MKENFEEFCGSTSLHAWNRLPSSRDAIRRIYWILVITGSILLGSFFVYENVDQFLKSYSTSSVGTTTGPLEEATFPKVVICNSYKVRQSFLDTIFDKTVVTDDDSGYDTQELQDAFVKHFIKGYKEEEANELKDRIDVVIEKYVDTDYLNETLVRECPFDPNYPYYCLPAINVLENRQDLALTSSQSFSSMILQYKIQNKTYYGGYLDWNSEYSDTDIGFCFGIKPRYIGPEEFSDPNATIEEAFVPKILSGAPFGVDILLDAETFDNGDIEEPFNGFTVAVSDREDLSLIGLDGFTVGTGSMARVSTQISIHKTSDVVLERFDSEERKCIDDSDNYNINITMDYDGKYTLSKCLLDASVVKIMAKECPEIDPQTPLASLYGQDLYCSFTKVNAAIGHDKATVTTDGKDVECQVACQRQENQISISTQGFPGEAFSRTREFWLVVYKLFWSCKNKKTKFGFKRPGLERKYPELCAFYDDYFYNDNSVNQKLESFDKVEGSASFLDWQKQELHFTQFESQLGMAEAEQEKFRQAVMLYCRDNLARVVVFIQKPFVTIYLRDQVMSYLQLVANMGGLMGLCMGFSVVSVAEIFYHLVINPILHLGCKKEEEEVASAKLNAW